MTQPKIIPLTVLVGVALLVSFLGVPNAWAGESVSTAQLYSALLPGGGHLYAGEPDKGIRLMGLYASSLGLAVITGPWGWEEKDPDDFFSDLKEASSTTKAIFWASAAVATGTWVYAFRDTPRAIERVSLSPEWTGDGVRLALTVAY